MGRPSRGVRGSRCCGRPDETRADKYCDEHLIVDVEAFWVSVDRVPVRLTRREFDLLTCFVGSPDRCLSRDRLSECVWGVAGAPSSRTVDVHVGRLRAKLGAAGTQIETVVGMGYRFVQGPKHL